MRLTGTNAVVYSPEADMILYAKHELQPKPLASLTKVMTAQVALNEAGILGTIELNDIALKSSGNDGLIPGEKWNLPDLVGFMLSVSSNDAAEAIKMTYDSQISNDPLNGTTFIHKMNEAAKLEGLSSLSFESPSGLDNDGKPSATGSALDVAKMFAYAYHEHPDVFALSSEASHVYTNIDGMSHKAENRNPLTSKWSLLASKTGFTNSAGGNLAVIYQTADLSPLVLVVMGSTEKDRFTDIDQLLTGSEQFLQAMHTEGITMNDIREQRGISNIDTK
jgi:D-alanyl-D-alanine carboxypeptidase